MSAGYYGESRLDQVLAIEKKKDGVWEQCAWYSHPDLHDELVLNVDGPFATVATAETLAIRILIVGDRNAGKSTLLHSFMNAHDRDWLWLSSVFPVLSGAFSNVRYGPQGPFILNGEQPPRDELPYLDTDVARCTLVLTKEDYLFFCQEFSLPMTHLTQQHDYVALELYELGGDHLDAMMNQTPISEMHAAALAKSKALLEKVSSLAYFVNCTQLNSAPENGLRQLEHRLKWLREQSTCNISLFLSRLPPTVAEECQLLAKFSSILKEKSQQRFTQEKISSSIQYKENDNTRTHLLYEAIRLDDEGTVLSHGLQELLAHKYPELGVTRVRPARHVTLSHAQQSSVHVPGLISVLVALCRSHAVVSTHSTWLELFTCAIQAASTLHCAPDSYVFAPAVSPAHFAEWLEDAEQRHTCCGGGGVHKMPAHLALSRFAEAAKALVIAAFLHRSDADGHAYPRVILKVGERQYTVTNKTTTTFRESNNTTNIAFFAQAGQGQSIAEAYYVRAPLFPPLSNLLSRCLEHDLVDYTFPPILKPELLLASEKLDAAILHALNSPSDDMKSWLHHVLWLAEDRILLYSLQHAYSFDEDTPVVVDAGDTIDQDKLPPSSSSSVVDLEQLLQIDLRCRRCDSSQ